MRSTQTFRRHLKDIFIRCFLLSSDKQTFMDYVGLMRRRSAVGGALEMFSLPLPLPITKVTKVLYFPYLGGSPRWADSTKRLHGG